MAKATPEQKRKANRAAAIVSVCVIAFACAFYGLVSALDRVATANDDDAREDIVITDEVEENPFYVLLIGSDSRKGTALYTGKAGEDGQRDQRSDTMTLMRVDPRKYKISLLSIPRDTVVGVNDPKINSALLDNDPNQVIEAVYDLCGLRADYYMMTTFLTFADLVDAVGGVTVDVPREVTVSDPASGNAVTVKAGEGQLLDGAHALAFARARFDYVDQQDAFRQANVRAIEEALIRRVMDSGSDLDIEAVLAAIEDDVVTNMDLAEIAPTIVDFVNHSNKVKFLEGTGPFEVTERETDGQWVVMPDQRTWKLVMNAFKTGKEFGDIVPLPEIPEAPDAGKSSASAASKSTSSASARSASASSASASAASAGSSATSAKKSAS